MTRTPDFLLVDYRAPEKRTCGECRACCTSMGVVELEKPYHERCRFQQDAPLPGCAIYKDRPGTCRAWQCGWLAQPVWDMIDFYVPSAWRPDKVGFTLSMVPHEVTHPVTSEQGLFMYTTLKLHEKDSLVWKSESILPELLIMSRSSIIGVGYAENVSAVLYAGKIRELTDAEQTELRYKHEFEVWPGVKITSDPGTRW